MEMHKAWYAVRTTPNHEKAVSKSLELKGVEQYLPLYSVRQRWKDRFKVVQFPLFAGYVFCRTEASEYLVVANTLGVIDFVRSGRYLAEVSAEEIGGLRKVVDSGVVFHPSDTFLAGDPVRILSGPLTGLDATVICVNKKLELVVSVTIVQRSLRVAIDPDWAVHIGPKSHPLIAAQAAQAVRSGSAVPHAAAVNTVKHRSF